MVQATRAKFIAILIITAVALFVIAPIPGKPRIPVLSDAKVALGFDLAGGAELRYKVLFPSGFEGDRTQATRLASDVIRRRLETRLLRESKVSSYGSNGILIQLAGIDAEGLCECKRLIETLGNLELHAAASQDLQELYDRDQVLPAGYVAVKSVDGTFLLIQKDPVIEGRHILNAEPHEEMGAGGTRWATSFELNGEGTKLFDEAAEKLYRQRPAGRIVILLDGEVRSAPVVQSPAFHGRGLISGAKNRKEALDLSIILRSGSLPAPIGSE